MFALAASYFIKVRAAAIGSVNFCYGIGVLCADSGQRVPVVYKTWRAPMIAFDYSLRYARLDPALRSFLVLRDASDSRSSEGRRGGRVF